MKGQVEVQESYDSVIYEQQHKQYLALICLLVGARISLFPCHDSRLGKHRDQNNGENAD